MSHTPGPWRIRGEYSALADVIGVDGRVVAVVWTRRMGTRREEPAEAWAEGEANARLIVAAPELLAALKDVLRIAKAASIGISGNTPRIARAEAAIAKAEGA